MQITGAPNGEQKEKLKAAASSFIWNAEAPLVFRVENPKAAPYTKCKVLDYVYPGSLMLPSGNSKPLSLPSVLDLCGPPPLPVNNTGERGLEGMLHFQRKPWVWGQVLTSWPGSPGHSLERVRLSLFLVQWSHRNRLLCLEPELTLKLREVVCVPMCVCACACLVCAQHCAWFSVY